MEPKRSPQTETDTDDEDYDTYITKRTKFSIPEPEQRRRPKCFTKNALMARENRLKKKMYIESLEKNVVKLTEDNRGLRRTVHKQSRKIAQLTKEIGYFKGVLSNSSDISKILRAIHHNTGMLVGGSSGRDFTSNYVLNKTENVFSESPTGGEDLGVLFDDPELSVVGRCDDDNVLEEHDYSTQWDSANLLSDDVGICLHVSKRRVSLEFCPKCSEDSVKSWEKHL